MSRIERLIYFLSLQRADLPTAQPQKQERATGPHPTPQQLFGPQPRNAAGHTCAGMAPRNGQVTAGRFTDGGAGGTPTGPAPQLMPWGQPAWQGRQQALGPIPQALVAGCPPLPPRPETPPLLVAQWPTPQQAAQLRPDHPPALIPGRSPLTPWPQAHTGLKMPLGPVQGTPPMRMPEPANYMQAQRWQQPQGLPQRPVQAQNLDAYLVDPWASRNGRQRRRRQQATNVSVAKLPPNINRLYKELNLKVTADTWPAFTTANLKGRWPTKLGSGAFNTVFAVRLEKADGTAFDGVFKPLSTYERGWVSGATGIPNHDPQIAMRNLSTLSYAKKLNVNVIPDTRVAAIETGPGQVEGPKLGLVMERARGVPAASADPGLFDRADVRRDVTWLQLLDHLTGQGDRHSNNYFIDILPNGCAKVTGIDNDQCFGHRLTDPNGIQKINNRTNYGFNGTSLPPSDASAHARRPCGPGGRRHNRTPAGKDATHDLLRERIRRRRPPCAFGPGLVRRRAPALPPVPPHLVASLQLQPPGWFATRAMSASPYDLDHFLAEIEARSDVPDYAIVGFDGHGSNSWAAHYYLVTRSIALFIQLPWGGAYLEPEPARADIVDILEWAGQLQSKLRLAEILHKIPQGTRFEVVASRFGHAGWRWLHAGDDAATPWNPPAGIKAATLQEIDDLVAGRRVLKAPA